MVQHKRKSAQSVAREKSLTLNVRRTAVSLAVAAALPGAMMLPQVAVAQDDGEVVEEVVVTGFRSALRNSMLMKQNNDSIVEAVTAEDIGKLPDASIAESLARLPGLTAQRLNGRGQQISVRGLGPDFTTALLNGREQVTTGDNRGVEFDQYPSELLSGVVVYKTPDSSLIGAGLSGTANLQTIRPLTHGSRILAGSARYEWNDLSAVPGATDDGARYSLTYVDQFADDTVGVALGVAHMGNPNQEERFEAWGYADGPDGSNVIGGAKPFLRSGELDRTGVIGTLEFMPTERLTTSVDVFYSEFEENQQLKGIEVPLQWGGHPLSNETIDNGLVTSGQYSDVVFVARNDILRRESELLSAGWNINFDLSENWVMSADLSTSRVDRTDTDRESYTGTGYNGNGATGDTTFRMTGSGAVFNSSLGFDDPNQLVLTDPRGWGGSNVQAGYQKIFNIEDELNQLGLALEREFNGPISNIELGVNIASREKTKDTDEALLNFGGATEAALPNSTGLADLSFVGLGQLVTYDPLSIDYTLQPNFNGDITLKNWSVEEDVNLAYIKLGIDTEWGSVPVTGNVGIQVMDVEQSSTAFATQGDGVTGNSNTGGTDWTEVLPSLNLTFALVNDNYLRFSLARTVARARMDQMRAAFSYDFNADNFDETDIENSPWSASGGNPEVKPWVADGIDLSYEKYFEDGAGYVSVAVFYKDLKEFIIEQDLPFDFTGFPAPLPPGTPIGTNLGFINTPINGQGGDIQGVELAVQFSGDLISDAIRNFGIVANYSHTTSSVKADGINEIKIPGLSEDVANVTGYYENENFSVRVSNRYRSEFLGEVAGFGGDRNFRTIKSESVLDAQIGYIFGGRLEGLTVMLQGFNLSDEPLGSFDNEDERFVRDNQRYGRSYMIGVSYRVE
ncbi:MAG: TonB-dependent receptor [Pseudomonadota bacterium]